jgi:hypothetical protein
MRPPPRTLDSFEVVAWTPLDARHEQTGNTQHYLGNTLMGKPAALAICSFPAENAFYLFYCDSDWVVLTDTYHESLDRAKGQAAFEFNGVEASWVPVT